jgi:hypothetical protein
MPCMCGDTCCPSCGPAQGNWKCPLCGAWASDGCDHVYEDSESALAIRPEWAADAEQAATDPQDPAVPTAWATNADGGCFPI